MKFIQDRQIMELCDDENIPNWKAPYYIVDIRDYLAIRDYYKY